METKLNFILISFLVISSISGTNTFLKSLSKELIEQTARSAFCFINNNGTVYDLNPLSNTQSDYTIVGPDYAIDFNICKKAISQCTNKTSLITYSNTLMNECISLSGSATVVSKWKVISDDTTGLIKLQASLPEGDECRSDTNKRYQTIFDFTCDEKAETPVVDNSLIFNTFQCVNTISVKSKHACPKFDFYSFWQQIISNKYIFGTILIVAGIFFCFFGKKFIKFTQILSGVLLVSFFTLYLLFSLLHIQYSTLEFWLLIIVSVSLGVLAGWFISKIEWLPPMSLGGFLGFLAGMMLYQVVLKFISANPVAVYWITILGCITIGALLGYFLAKHILIVGSAFIGAYGLIRGISFMAGNFPDEKQIIDLVELGEWDQVTELFTWHVYLYFAAILILGVVGSIVQYKYFGDDESQTEKNSEHIDEAALHLINKNK